MFITGSHLLQELRHRLPKRVVWFSLFHEKREKARILLPQQSGACDSLCTRSYILCFLNFILFLFWFEFFENRNLKPQLVCMKEADETFCAEDLGGPLICDNKLVAILHTLYDLRNCKKHSTKVAPACDKRTTISVCTYICPYLTWIKHYVPTIPDRPPSCRSSPIITPSALVVLFYFVFIVITHSWKLLLQPKLLVV